LLILPFNNKLYILKQKKILISLTCDIKEEEENACRKKNVKTSKLK
jgi:hypothetical protein